MLQRRRPASDPDRQVKETKRTVARKAPEEPTSFRGAARPSHEEITRRAYEIFIERGRPEGRDVEHWLEAEGQLIAALQPQARSPAAGTLRRTTASRQTGRRT